METKKLNTNCKEVRNKVNDHILNNMTKEDLLLDVESLVNYDREVFNDYQAIAKMVQGGCFEVYYGDVKDFLNSLGINPSNKEYDDQKSWDLYKHLIAINGERILKAYRKERN